MINNRTTYKKIVSILQESAMYNPADDLTIQLLADQIDLYKKVRAQLKEVAFETTTDKGATTYRPHPAGKMLMDLGAQIAKLLADLNMTSKARKDMGTGSETATAAIHKFLGS